MPTTLTAYTFNELSPEAQDRAISRMPFDYCEYTAQECAESLQAFSKRLRIPLKDWSIGDMRDSFSRFELGDAADLEGPRAFAWIENNVFGPLRQSWNLRDKARRYTRPGEVPACPFTGVCFDENILDVFRKYDGRETLQDLFRSVGDALTRVIDADIEYTNSEEARRERAGDEFDGVLFDEDGDRVR